MKKIFLYLVLCSCIFAKGIVKDTCTQEGIFKNNITFCEMHERLVEQQDVLRSPKIRTALKLLAAKPLKELDLEQQCRILRIALFSKGLHDTYRGLFEESSKPFCIQNCGWFKENRKWLLISGIAIAGGVLLFGIPTIDVVLCGVPLVCNNRSVFKADPILPPPTRTGIVKEQSLKYVNMAPTLEMQQALCEICEIPADAFEVFNRCGFKPDILDADIPIRIGYTGSDTFTISTEDSTKHINPASFVIATPAMTNGEKETFYSSLPQELQYNEAYDDAMWDMLPFGELLTVKDIIANNVIDDALSAAENDLSKAFYLNTTAESPIFTTETLSITDINTLLLMYCEDCRLLQALDEDESLEALFDKEAIEKRLNATEPIIEKTMDIVAPYCNIEDIEALQKEFNASIVSKTLEAKKVPDIVSRKHGFIIRTFHFEESQETQQDWINKCVEKFAPDFIGIKLPDIDECDSPEKKYTSSSPTSSINRSAIFQLTAFYEDISKLNNSAILFVNGVNNTRSDAEESAKYISDLAGGIDIATAYNATHGIISDIFETKQNIEGKITTPGKYLVGAANHYFKTHPSADAMLTIICHSQGVAIVKSTIPYLSEHVRSKIDVYAVAPSTFIPKEAFHNVRHYVSKADFVVKLIGWCTGEKLEGANITTVDSKDKGWLSSHSFKSENYEEAIKIGAREAVRYDKKLLSKEDKNEKN